MSKIINELELLATEMVCGHCQLRIYKRIETLKQVEKDRKKKLKVVVWLWAVMIITIIICIVLFKIFNSI